MNQASFLPTTIRSILDQQADVEILVVDGGSTDGTVAWLESNGDPRIRWISERDRGQSHAINKGLAQAGGEIVTWLNSDDLYEPGALKCVAGAFESNPHAKWLIGDCRIVNERGEEIRRWVSRYKRRSLIRYSFRRLLGMNFISQMSVFWRGRFATELGALDESLHYCMDYDLWLRMGKASEPLIIDKVLANFRYHAASKTGAVDPEEYREMHRVSCRYSGNDRLARWRSWFNAERIIFAYGITKRLGI